MGKRQTINTYLIIFAIGVVIIIAVFLYFSLNKKDNPFIPKSGQIKDDSDAIALKLYYDFEGEAQLFEFKEYWNNYKLIEDKSGYGNEGHLIPYDRVYYPELVLESFKGKALKFDNKGELEVKIKDLIAPQQDLAIIFYFKPLNNVKYKIGLNEILLIEEDKSKPFPGEVRINLDRSLKMTPSNIISNNSELIRFENWNSFILNQKNMTISYILNGEKIADYPIVTNLNYMHFKPYYVIIDEVMVYNGSLTDEEISQLSVK